MSRWASATHESNKYYEHVTVYKTELSKEGKITLKWISMKIYKWLISTIGHPDKESLVNAGSYFKRGYSNIIVPSNTSHMLMKSHWDE